MYTADPSDPNRLRDEFSNLDVPALGESSLSVLLIGIVVCGVSRLWLETFELSAS